VSAAKRPQRSSGYFVDKGCFTLEALDKVVMLEPWEPDPRWVPHRDYDASEPIAVVSDAELAVERAAAHGSSDGGNPPSKPTS
jgi:hypothetical protein